MQSPSNVFSVDNTSLVSGRHPRRLRTRLHEADFGASRLPNGSIWTGFCFTSRFILGRGCFPLFRLTTGHGNNPQTAEKGSEAGPYVAPFQASLRVGESYSTVVMV